MSKHLAKTNMHLSDNDVKIWNSPGDDNDVKIWRKEQGNAAKSKGPAIQPEGSFEDDYMDDAASKLASKPVSRAAYRHDTESPVKRIGLILISSALLILDMFLPLQGWLRLVSFVVPFLVVGFDTLLSSIEEIIDGHILNDSLLVSIACVAAFAIGLFPEAVLLMLLYKLGLFLVSIAECRIRETADELEKLLPENADVESAEGVLSVSPDYVKLDDIIVVSPGEKVALDGVVIEGITSIDASALTGDSSPIDVTVGSQVYSGTENVTETIRVRVTKTYYESTAYRMFKLSLSTAGEYSAQERFAFSFSRGFKLLSVVLALIMGIVCPLFLGQWTEWIRRAVIILAASCPAAALASVTLSYAGASSNAFHSGISVKGHQALERLSKAETMVFDKSGTVTRGEYYIRDVYSVGISDQELLTIAATAESGTDHPIAKLLRQTCAVLPETEERKISTRDIPGRGVSAYIGEQHVYVGNAALLEEHGIQCVIPEKPGAAIHVAVNDVYFGHILISDKVRDGAFDALDSLRALGVKKTVLLTGDVLSVARPLASRLNFDLLRAELRPEDKLSAIDYLVKNRGDNATVAFVSDGGSNIAALKRADIGIAMGALEYISVIEQADVSLMTDDIRKLPEAMGLAKTAYRVAVENAAVVASADAIIVLLGATGVLPLAAAVIFNAVVLIGATLNSVRTTLLYKRRTTQKAEGAYNERIFKRANRP